VQSGASGEGVLDKSLRLGRVFVPRCQRKSELGRVRYGRLVNLQNPSAKCVLQADNHAGDPIILSEPGDLDGKVGCIARCLEVSVAVADQSHDTLHAGPDCVTFEVRDLTVQRGNRSLELFPWSVMECVGVPRRQFPREEREILTPLRRGELQVLRLGVGGNRE